MCGSPSSSQDKRKSVSSHERASSIFDSKRSMLCMSTIPLIGKSKNQRQEGGRKGEGEREGERKEGGGREREGEKRGGREREGDKINIHTNN